MVSGQGESWEPAPHPAGGEDGLRGHIGEDGAAVGEPDALSTRAQLLAEKRIGFLLLTVGLVLYLRESFMKSSEDPATMGTIACAVVMVGLVVRATLLATYGIQPPGIRAGRCR